MNAACFDSILESSELIGVEAALAYIPLGFVSFHLLGRLIYWCHGRGHMRIGGNVKLSEKDERTRIKSFVYLSAGRWHP